MEARVMRDHVLRRGGYRHLLLVAALHLHLSVPAHAAPADPDLTDYVLTTWTTKDGLPSDVITAIGQDGEGYLWLGTNDGLVRFDGTRFASWDTLSTERLPRAPIRSLAVSRDGSVWIGFAESGGISRILNGRVRTWGSSTCSDAPG
jgi:ligand-binding sensor domain-containing protein